MTTKLSGNGITLLRGERVLIRGLGFALQPGELIVLEGQNGTGKTSLLKAIAGMLELEAGEILWGDTPVRRRRQEYCDELVWMAHRTGFKADLTLVENLRFEANLRPMAMQDIDAVLERLELLRLKKLPLRFLSAGQQRRVGLARMLLSTGRLWLLDEPFTNLDREGRRLVVEILSEHLASDGMCVMAAHQDVDVGAPTTRIRL